MKKRTYVISDSNIGVVIGRIKTLMSKAYIVEKPKSYIDNSTKQKTCTLINPCAGYNVRKVFALSDCRGYVYWKIEYSHRHTSRNAMKGFTLCNGDQVEIMSDRSIRFYKRKGGQQTYKGCIKPLLNTWHEITADNMRDICIFMMLANLIHLDRYNRICFGAAAVRDELQGFTKINKTIRGKNNG